MAGDRGFHVRQLSGYSLRVVSYQVGAPIKGSHKAPMRTLGLHEVYTSPPGTYPPETVLDTSLVLRKPEQIQQFLSAGARCIPHMNDRWSTLTHTFEQARSTNDFTAERPGQKLLECTLRDLRQKKCRQSE